MRNLVLFVCVIAAGCGNKKSSGAGGSSSGGGGDAVASCRSDSMHGCREYRGGNLAAGSDNLAQLCTVVDKASVFAMTACPTANVIGTCTKPEGKDFYYQGYDLEPVADLEKSCTGGGGTWSK